MVGDEGDTYKWVYTILSPNNIGSNYGKTPYVCVSYSPFVARESK